ncbi:MAG TPA: YjbQ family protein [Deltaproteobacteria bacterium]|nr:YjbQ family protein [Deltaproteobacteria bacterium]
MKQLSIRTNSRFEMIDITRAVADAVKEENVVSGICYVFVPHTTAAVTINENADPDVPRDIIMELDKVIPFHDNYRHMEGNSAAHIKTSLIGSSEAVFVENGNLVLGTWQSLFFCEFDGPRTRKYMVKVIATD